MIVPPLDLSALKRDIAIECREDYVGLWLVRTLLTEQFPNLDKGSARAETLRLIRELLHEYDDVVIGNTTPEGGFVEWDVDPSEAITRIASGWLPDGPDPDIGQNAWLASKAFLRDRFRH